MNFKKYFLLIIFFISIFISNIEISEARRIKIGGGGVNHYYGGGHYGSKIHLRGVNLFKNNSGSSFISNSDIDYSRCLRFDFTFNYDSKTFLVPLNFIFPNSEFEIDELKRDIENTYVNQYDSGSVNYYNSKVNKINKMIDENNKHLEKEGVPLKEYCKPYVCNKKYPGSRYNKETDTCDDQEYNHPYDICEVGKCKLLNNCFPKPDNAICVSNDKNNAWKCKSGFEEKDGVCIEIKKNQESIFNKENSGISLNENDLFLEENNTGILDSSYTGSYMNY